MSAVVLPRLRRAGAVPLLLLVLAEAGAVRALHALAAVPGLAGPGTAPSAWPHWLRVTPAEDVVAACVRLLAAGLAWWLLLSTVLAVVATLLRFRRLQAVSAALTASVVRHVVDRGVAALLTASITLGPIPLARAATPPTAAARGEMSLSTAAPEALARTGSPVGGLSGWSPLPPVWSPSAPAASSTGTGTPASGAAPSSADAPGAPGAPGAPDAPDALGSAPHGRPQSAPPPSHPDRQEEALEQAVHVVVRGEHLWGIAQQQLRAVRLDAATPEVAEYWRRLITANREVLRSGDPDLIFPGETVALPEPLPDGTPRSAAGGLPASNEFPPSG